MSTYRMRRLGLVFFCSVGWVCSGPVLAADEPAQETPAARTAQAGEAAKSNLFEGAEKDSKPSAPPPSAVKAAPVEAPVGADTEAQPQPTDKPFVPAEIPQGQTVKTGSFGEIDLHVKDLDIATVLQLLSIQAKRNIIATKNVSGSVTADLYQVDFYGALDSILEPNGFGYREKGKFIYVYTAKELAEIRKLEEKPIVKIHRLNYLNAKDASTFVTPLLSASGTIAISGEVPTAFQSTITDNGKNTSADQDVMVIRDLQGNVEDILKIIKELDIKPKQVSIRATVLKATMKEENGFGVDITVVGGATTDDFTTPLSVLEDLADGTVSSNGRRAGGVESNPGNTQAGRSNIKFGFIAGSVEAFVRALDEVTDTTVVANPEVLVLNRQRADLLIGGRLGYISTQQTETSTTQTVEFLDVGTQLTVRPFISDDGMVRLELRPSISTGETTLTGGFVIPSTQEQSMTTNVMVRNGQTVVIGGLFQEDVQVTRSQVPILGDVPIVGNAFKGVDDKSNRSEVIFLITPTIVKDEILYASGDRAVETVGQTMYGAREGTLPWSRSKQVAANMQDAIKYYKEGKKELALDAANKALNSDSTVVDAIKIKSALMGERVKFYERSILKDVINGDVDAAIKAKADAQNGAGAQPTVDATTQPAEVPAPATVDAQPAQPDPRGEEPAGNEQPQPQPAPATADADAQPSAQAQPEPANQPAQADAQNDEGLKKVLDAVNKIVADGNTPAPADSSADADQPQPQNPSEE